MMRRHAQTHVLPCANLGLARPESGRSWPRRSSSRHADPWQARADLANGKTTLAARLQDVVKGSAVVHTDDIAWWHSRFGWVQADQLEAGHRNLARVGQPGGPRTIEDHREWMAEEEPFLTGQRP
jgi:hypothetical protein